MNATDIDSWVLRDFHSADFNRDSYLDLSDVEQQVSCWYDWNEACQDQDHYVDENFSNYYNQTSDSTEEEEWDEQEEQVENQARYFGTTPGYNVTFDRFIELRQEEASSYGHVITEDEREGHLTQDFYRADYSRDGTVSYRDIQQQVSCWYDWTETCSQQD